MAESTIIPSITASIDVNKNSTLQRPTSLTVVQPSSPLGTGAVNNAENFKTPSPLKRQSPTAIIQIPPSPIQNKIPLNSPTLETSTACTNAPQTSNSVSFMEMASSFFRWGGKGGSSATATLSQSDIVASKVESSPKSTIVDIEGTSTEQHSKLNKTSVDKSGQAPVINVITNPNENLKLSNATSASYCAPDGAPGKQRTSRKTMRAPQPPIVDTPKAESRLSSQGPTQHSSPDAADVQEKTEEKLLKLLSDFDCGKLKAFSEDGRQGGTNMMPQMEDIRDQQEALGKLHFELCGAGIGVVVDGKKQPAPLSKERLSNANDNMNRLMTHLEKLSLAIESLSPAINPTFVPSSTDNGKRP